MPEPAYPVLLEFLGWVAREPRTYEQVMETWRSTCPRHTAWEDAIADGLVRVEPRGALHESLVQLTPRGKSLLDGLKTE